MMGPCDGLNGCTPSPGGVRASSPYGAQGDPHEMTGFPRSSTLRNFFSTQQPAVYRQKVQANCGVSSHQLGRKGCMLLAG